MTLDPNLKSKGHILIVDDDPDIINLCRIFLKPLKCKVVSSSSPQNALQVLVANEIDLLIVDLMMPKIDGFEFIRRLKATEVFRGSILILTAIADTESVKMAIQLGAVDYICKPLDRSIFISKVQKALKAQGCSI